MKIREKLLNVWDPKGACRQCASQTRNRTHWDEVICNKCSEIEDVLRLLPDDARTAYIDMYENTNVKTRRKTRDCIHKNLPQYLEEHEDKKRKKAELFLKKHCPKKKVKE